MSLALKMATERGGNCELTRAGETIVDHNVTIMGPLNISSTIPYHASQMYSANVTAFLLNLVKQGELALNCDDPIIAETLVTREGQIVHPRVRQLLNLPALAEQTLET